MDVFLASLLPWGLVVPNPPWAEVKACLGVVYPQPPACCFAGGLRSALLSNLTTGRADCCTLKGRGPGGSVYQITSDKWPEGRRTLTRD